MSLRPLSGGYKWLLLFKFLSAGIVNVPPHPCSGYQERWLYTYIQGLLQHPRRTLWIDFVKIAASIAPPVRPLRKTRNFRLLSSSSLCQSHESAYRRSLAVSSTIISYISLCDHLEVQTSIILMFQIYKKVIKNHEELTSCSSLMHSYLFPLLDVLYRQVGNLSFWTERCTEFRYDGQ